MKACFEPVWEELNELIGNPSLTVDGREVELDIVFGSDYKVGLHSVKLSVKLICIFILSSLHL